jgi:Transglutaminase-like superfamily
MPRDPAFWSAAAPMTDLSSVNARALSGLPDDPLDVCRIAAGVMVHEAWAGAYGFEVPPDRSEEVELRPAAAIVDAILALDDRPLVAARPVDKRVVGVCRHFTTLSVALLRSKGVPARSRCGFGTYFEPGKFIDHWIVERWDAEADRWVGVDTQMDDVQRAALRLDFDAGDVPPNRFLNGGAAWQRARAGVTPADAFGIYAFWGWDMLRGNLVRDIAALNKVELLPWDDWGAISAGGGPDAFGDQLAVASIVGDLDGVRAAYADGRVRVPGKVFSARFQRTVEVPTDA